MELSPKDQARVNNERVYFALTTSARNDCENHFALNKHVNTVVGNLPVIGGSEELEILKQQFDIVDEEVSETLSAADEDESENLKDLRDGLGDVLVTYDGMLVRLGLKPVDFVCDTDVRVTGTALERRTDQTLQSRIHFSIGRTHALVREVVINAQRNGTYNREHLRFLIASILAATEEAIALAGAITMDDQFQIFLSNMSKFDTDRATAEQGVAKYTKMGVKTRIEETEVAGTRYFVIKVAEFAEIGNKKFVPGKFLKGVNFFEPVFGPLVQDESANEAASA